MHARDVRPFALQGLFFVTMELPKEVVRLAVHEAKAVWMARWKCLMLKSALNASRSTFVREGVFVNFSKITLHS